jgi:Tfp pilus assembly protein PilZ
METFKMSESLYDGEEFVGHPAHIQHDGRQFVRHPAHIPIEVKPLKEETVIYEECLKDVSLGGLAFHSDTSWEVGSVITISLQIKPLIELNGKVVWSRPHKNHFDVGVKFIGTDNFSKKELEEVCQIEIYQQLINDIEIGVLHECYEDYP